MTGPAKKVLIVDDNEDILDVLKEIMAAEGYIATTLAFTDDIIGSVKQHQPDLVLMDYMMPGINGGELCHRIKSDPATSHIPVLILSAYPKVLETLSCYGSDAFIAKPFALDELTYTVRYLLWKSERMGV